MENSQKIKYLFKNTIFSSKSYITFRLGRMVTYGDLILPTQSFWPFWSFGHGAIKVQNFLKRLSQKYQICLTLIEIIKKHMTIKLVRMDTHDDLLLPKPSCDLLTFWSFGHVTFKVQKLLKGHSQKISVYLKLIERNTKISSLPKVVLLLNLLEWTLLWTYDDLLLPTLSCDLFIVQNIKGHSMKILLCLKLKESIVCPFPKVVWLLNLLELALGQYSNNKQSISIVIVRISFETFKIRIM